MYVIDSLPSLVDDDVITISPPNSPEEKKPHLNFPSSFGTSCSQIAGSTSFNQWPTSPLKKRSSDSQSTSSSQIQSSQISGNMSNATCGSCKEKGHNRKWVHCPNFHSFEETQRRRVIYYRCLLECNLFLPWYTGKIVHLALNNNDSLTQMGNLQMINKLLLFMLLKTYYDSCICVDYIVLQKWHQ